MSTANTLFVMIASILVFLMTPGLAFFYGGLVSRRNIVNTFMSVFFVCGLSVLLWVAVGWSLSFSCNGAIVGNLHQLMMHGTNLKQLTTGKIPVGIFSIFEMMFALITPALFVGAIVGRVRFKFLTFFIICWSILIYYPLVHLVWGGGLLSKLGTLDFAGGTVVHINAGVTALVLSAMIGPRLHTKDSDGPADRSWVLLGTTLLWIGWDGFNAGSALAVNSIAMQAFLTTTVAAAAAMVTWQLLEIYTEGHTTLVGTCTGVLCGLVGITPACGYVTLTGALIIGIGSSLISGWFITKIKPRLKVDDTLDAFGCHGVSGIWGSIATGLFATHTVNPAVTHDGLLMGGGFTQFGIQTLATLVTIIATAAMVWAIVKVLGRFMTIRVSAREEGRGLDISEHHELIGSLANPQL